MNRSTCVIFINLFLCCFFINFGYISFNMNEEIREKKRDEWLMFPSPVEKYQRVYESTKAIAFQTKIATPALTIISHDGLVSMSNFGKDFSLIYFSASLIEELTDEEIEGAIAHEIGHIHNNDVLKRLFLKSLIFSVRLVIFLAVIFLVIALIKSLKERVFNGMFVCGSLFAVLLSFSVLQVLYFYNVKLSYSFEMAADEFASKILGGPQKMMNVLETIEKVYGTHYDSDNSGKEEAFLKKLFLGSEIVHPPREVRIKALRAME